MVKAKKDLTGMVFGRLTVLEQAEDYIHPNGTHRARWKCQCSCEKKTITYVTGDRLNAKGKRGVKSCGCLQRESLVAVHNGNKKSNIYDLSGEYGIGWTSNTNEEFYFDLEDYDKIKDYCWRAAKDDGGYRFIEASYNQKHLLMSNIIAAKYSDHINRNTFDNRKSNLRPATTKENARNRSIPSNNTSGIIGVSFHNADFKWVAQIGIDGKRVRIGGYVDFENAVVARLQAELQYFGPEFAPQRHLFEQYKIN